MTEEFDEDVVFEVCIKTFCFFLIETSGCFVIPPEFRGKRRIH